MPYDSYDSATTNPASQLKSDISQIADEIEIHGHAVHTTLDYEGKMCILGAALKVVVGNPNSLTDIYTGRLGEIGTYLSNFAKKKGDRASEYVTSWTHVCDYNNVRGGPEIIRFLRESVENLESVA